MRKTIAVTGRVHNPNTGGGRYISVASMVPQARNVFDKTAGILMEDTVAKMARDIMDEFTNLPEIRCSKLLKSYCHDIYEIFNKRSREIRRDMNPAMAQCYDNYLCETVDRVESHYDAMVATVKTAMTQIVCYQDIRRTVLVSICRSLLNLATEAHKFITGKKGYYQQAVETLDIIEKKVPPRYLNKGREEIDNDMCNAAFERMFNALQESVVQTFVGEAKA